MISLPAEARVAVVLAAAAGCLVLTRAVSSWVDVGPPPVPGPARVTRLAAPPEELRLHLARTYPRALPSRAYLEGARAPLLAALAAPGWWSFGEDAEWPEGGLPLPELPEDAALFLGVELAASGDAAAVQVEAADGAVLRLDGHAPGAEVERRSPVCLVRWNHPARPARLRAPAPRDRRGRLRGVWVGTLDATTPGDDLEVLLELLGTPVMALAGGTHTRADLSAALARAKEAARRLDARAVPGEVVPRLLALERALRLVELLEAVGPGRLPEDLRRYSGPPALRPLLGLYRRARSQDPGLALERPAEFYALRDALRQFAPEEEERAGDPEAPLHPLARMLLRRTWLPDLGAGGNDGSTGMRSLADMIVAMQEVAAAREVPHEVIARWARMPLVLLARGRDRAHPEGYLAGTERALVPYRAAVRLLEALDPSEARDRALAGGKRMAREAGVEL